MKEKGNVDIQTNQCGLGGEILASSTLSAYVIGLEAIYLLLIGFLLFNRSVCNQKVLNYNRAIRQLNLHFK